MGRAVLQGERAMCIAGSRLQTHVSNSTLEEGEQSLAFNQSIGL